MSPLLGTVVCVSEAVLAVCFALMVLTIRNQNQTIKLLHEFISQVSGNLLNLAELQRQENRKIYEYLQTLGDQSVQTVKLFKVTNEMFERELKGLHQKVDLFTSHPDAKPSELQ